MIAAFFRNIWQTFRDGVRLWWASLLVGTMAALAGTAFRHGHQPLRWKDAFG